MLAGREMGGEKPHVVSAEVSESTPYVDAAAIPSETETSVSASAMRAAVLIPL